MHYVHMYVCICICMFVFTEGGFVLGRGFFRRGFVRFPALTMVERAADFDQRYSNIAITLPVS